MGRSGLHCNDITFEAWRRVTRSRCGVVTATTTRARSHKSLARESAARLSPVHLALHHAAPGFDLRALDFSWRRKAFPLLAAGLKRACDRAELATLPGVQLPPG